MTMGEALQILLDNGFTYNKLFKEIYYCGERVGDYAINELWLCDFQPSAIDLSYLQVPKIIIHCGSNDCERRLREQIANLLDTPRQYEEFCRREKIENIKKYFQDRKEAVSILNQPQFDYTQLVIQRKEEKLE